MKVATREQMVVEKQEACATDAPRLNLDLLHRALLRVHALHLLPTPSPIRSSHIPAFLWYPLGPATGERRTFEHAGRGETLSRQRPAADIRLRRREAYLPTAMPQDPCICGQMSDPSTDGFGSKNRNMYDPQCGRKWVRDRKVRSSMWLRCGRICLAGRLDSPNFGSKRP